MEAGLHAQPLDDDIPKGTSASGAPSPVQRGPKRGVMKGKGDEQL